MAEVSATFAAKSPKRILGLQLNIFSFFENTVSESSSDCRVDDLRIIERVEGDIEFTKQVKQDSLTHSPKFSYFNMSYQQAVLKSSVRNTTENPQKCTEK